MQRRKKVLYETKSPYGTYRVVDMTYDDRPARVLFGDRNSPQSGMALDDNPELIFDYNQRFLEIMHSIRPQTVLVIGGGVGMLPTAAFHQFPNMTIDVVEIDETVVRIARDFFALPDDPRYTVHITDGLDFLRQAQGRYDMIILDAFLGYTIPHHLLTEEAVRLYRQFLSPHGVVAVNFISEYRPRRRRLAHEIIDIFRTVFPEVALYQADASYRAGDEQNYILTASSRLRDFDYLQSTARELM